MAHFKKIIFVWSPWSFTFKRKLLIDKLQKLDAFYMN